MFDLRSNMQVRASLGELHRAIDRAVSLDDQRAGRDTGGGGGGGAEPEEARQGQDHSLGAQVAPVPAEADLVYYASVPDGP